MNDLTFGIRITADAKAATAGIEEARRGVERLGAAGGKMASQYSGLNQAVKQHSAAVTDTERNVNKLLDRYDPLGAKLRQLQADFKALDAAAASGKIAGRDDARVDAVYARLQKEIAATSASTVGFAEASGKAARSAGQLRMATQQLPMQFTDIWVSLAAGQSPMMVMLQQGTQIKDSFGGVGNAAAAMGRYMLGIINPITLVTAALAAGAYAWTRYENVAVESAEKTMDALQKAIGEGRRLTSMGRDTLDAEIANTEVSIRAKEALIDSLRADPKRRFNWRAAAEEEAKYNAEIKRGKSHLIELKSAREAAAGRDYDKLLEQSTYARRESLVKEIALLEAHNTRQQAGSREYLISLSAIQDKKKQLKEMDAAPAKPKRTAAEKELEHYQQLNDAATKHIAVLEAQAEQEDKLTESQKKLVEIGANYKQGLTAQNEAVQQGVIASLAQAAALEMEAVAKAEAAKALKEAAKASRDAQDESAKAIDKANTASKEYVNQLQFENSLLGLSTLEVQKRTEARKIDLALEKELLALRGNDKLKAEPAALKAAEDAARKAAEAAKAGAEVEIEARQRVTTSWEFGSREAIRKYDEAVKNSAAQAESLYTKAFKGAEDAVTKFVTTGKADIRDFANAVIEEFVRINISRPMVSGAAGFLGDWVGGLFGGGSSPTGMAGFSASQMAGPVMASANGNVFSGPGISAYSDSVVDKPTVFPFARGVGLMGEAGPEAILPLTRVNGRLGVQAQGGGASVTVNVINQSGAQVRTQERQDGSGGMTLDVIIEQIESGIARNVSRGAGALAGSMERSYGLNRAAGAY